MATKQNSAARGGEEPAEVFRQFAWHLAGSIASARVAASGNPGAAKGAGKGAVKR
jgi:hypothetical protein